jgi:hypothetical protein
MQKQKLKLHVKIHLIYELIKASITEECFHLLKLHIPISERSKKIWIDYEQKYGTAYFGYIPYTVLK